MRRANGNQFSIGFFESKALRRRLIDGGSIELLFMFVIGAALAVMVVLRNHEYYEENCSKYQTANRRHRFRDEVSDGRQENDEKHDAETNGNMRFTPAEIQGYQEFARRMILESQHHHRQSFEDETPHNAKGVRLAQHDHIATAHDDREKVACR